MLTFRACKLVDFELLQDGENFYYVVGDGKDPTLFCSHFDTADSVSTAVHHGFYNSTIHTHCKSILGADDKVGVAIMVYLIINKVPGTYYFFAGEEVGRRGSLAAVEENPDKFKRFDRAISFDRRGTGSIISKQLGSLCASDGFVDGLVRAFGAHSIKMENDPTGLYTDTASFADIIPECTNISAGFDNEHTAYETLNIDYAWQIARAAAAISWDSLPTNRDPFNKGKDYWWEYGSDDDYLDEIGDFNDRRTEYYPPKNSKHSKENIVDTPVSKLLPPPAPSVRADMLTVKEAKNTKTEEYDDLLNPAGGESPPKVL